MLMTVECNYKIFMTSCLLTKHFFLRNAIVVLSLVALLSLVYPVRCIPWNVMICGPNEGWNAYFQEAAMKGKGLYPSPDQFITNNYPPLSFYAVGFVGNFLGDNILAGRWIAFFSLLTIAFFIFKIIRELGGEPLAGLLGASFFVATMGLFFERYVAMNDPQLLAQSIMIGAFFLFLKAVKEKKKCFFPIALMVFAGFFKQNIVMFPITALLWLLVIKEQANFWKYSVFSALLIGVGFIFCYFHYGSYFFFNFLSPRRFFPIQEIAALLDLQSVALATIISSAILWRNRHQKNIDLIFIMLAVGLVAHFLQRFGSGVDSNSQFDFNIAVALAVGMSFHLLKKRKKEAHQILFLVIILIPLLLAPGRTLIKKGVSSHFNEEARWRERCLVETIKKVQSTPGDVLTEPYIAYRAGKSFIIDGFNFEERIQAGIVKSTVPQDLVNKHQLTKICIDPNALWPYDDFNFVPLKSHFQSWPNAADRVL